MLKNNSVEDISVCIDLHPNLHDDSYKYRVKSNPDFPGLVDIQYMEWDSLTKIYTVKGELCGMDTLILNSILNSAISILKLEGE